jgi:hypothetical protein
MPGVDEGIVVCASDFSDEAHQFSLNKPIKLIGFAVLAHFIREYQPRIHY